MQKLQEIKSFCIVLQKVKLLKISPNSPKITRKYRSPLNSPGLCVFIKIYYTMLIMPLLNAAVSEGVDFYIRLVWLFSAIVILLTLLLCYLFLNMRKARKKEFRSRELSYMAIEGLETERRRISRELHDTILPQVHDLALSRQIRAICTDLMPPDFSCLLLKDALAQLCTTFSSRSKIECVCSIEKNIDFSFLCAENQLHLYRMVQESFNNIEKHSGAKYASLIVRRNTAGVAGNILVCVSDDGEGIKNGKPRQSLGMRSLHQRAEILDAKIDFLSESGNGLMVRIEIQVPPLISITEPSIEK
jgi:signal transduction histidine kinase